VWRVGSLEIYDTTRTQIRLVAPLRPAPAAPFPPAAIACLGPHTPYLPASSPANLSINAKMISARVQDFKHFNASREEKAQDEGPRQEAKGGGNR